MKIKKKTRNLLLTINENIIDILDKYHISKSSLITELLEEYIKKNNFKL